MIFLVTFKVLVCLIFVPFSIFVPSDQKYKTVLKSKNFVMKLNQKNKKNIFLCQWNNLNIFVTIEGIKTYHLLKSRGKTNEKIHVNTYIPTYNLDSRVPSFTLFNFCFSGVQRNGILNIPRNIAEVLGLSVVWTHSKYYF